MLDMMLYMFILIYGTMVMNSIIEEKNNRVLEIVVSSVKPSSLMLGKIVGIGLVAEAGLERERQHARAVCVGVAPDLRAPGEEPVGASVGEG